MLAWLDTRDPGAATGQLLAGEPRRIAADAPVTVHTPDGRELVLPPERAGEAVLRDTYVPGHYRVTRGDATPLTFAVQQDPGESDTRNVAPRPPSRDGDQVLAAALHPRWRPLVLLAAALLLAETLLRARRRNQ